MQTTSRPTHLEALLPSASCFLSARIFQFSFLLLLLSILASGCNGSGRKDEQKPAGTKVETTQDSSEEVKKQDSPFPISRGRVYIAVTESVDKDDLKHNVSQILLQRRFSQHGFEIVKTPEEARYLVTGHLKCLYFDQAVFHFEGTETHLEYQFKANGGFDLVDKQEQDNSLRHERFAFDKEPEIHGRTKMEDAILDIRRIAATKLSHSMLRGRILGPSFLQLFDVLQDPEDTRTLSEVSDEFVAAGGATVPYLIDELMNEGSILLEGEFPGVTSENREALKVFHFADSLLTKLLGKKSHLNVESSENYVYQVRTGWAWAWEKVQKVPAEYGTKRAKRIEKASPALSKMKQEEHR